MENRYGGILTQHNAGILAFSPTTGMMRAVVAHEFCRLYKPGMRVLEIGCGEGDSAEPVLRFTNASLVLLDASAEMVRLCRSKLAPYANRTQYVCADALEYLSDPNVAYDLIVSSWTIHNFPWGEKGPLLKAIWDRLTRGGSFLLMDKVYSGRGGKKLLELQNSRFRRYLPTAAADAIIAHEKQDYTRKYRMEEGPLFANLKAIGFRDVRVMERVERDIVLVAMK